LPFSPEQFQKSINNELILVKDRVKNLIDIETNHNGEDGNYREAILRNVIKRFLPNNVSIGTGFVVAKKNGIFNRTSQIDIILYDNSYPLLFKEGDFIITTPKNVKAIIEVKTTICNSRTDNSNGILNIINKAKDNYELIVSGNKKLFNGIFAYNYEDSVIDNRNQELSSVIQDSLRSSSGKVNHISLGDRTFIKYWQNQSDMRINPECQTNKFFNIYDLEELSFAYFISNLIYWITDKKMDDRMWFMFPIGSQNGKEDHRRKQFCIE
jgi:hypothetical protein